MLDKMATFFGQNVATSTPVAKSIPGPTIQIPNPVRVLFEGEGQPDDTREGLLFAGRLVSRKGGDVALRALSHLREWGGQFNLTICGDGPERDRLETLAYDLGVADHVHFLGWASPEKLASLYQRSWAALIPSRKEPFGIVALEAIAGGCPVVASNVGGLPEAVGDCGLLVEPEAPKALAEAIEEISNPGVRATVRESMPIHVERHRMENIAGKYLNLLDSMVRSSDA
jgi:glycosyltransferase involved in cell wall biosynthesis